MTKPTTNNDGQIMSVLLEPGKNVSFVQADVTPGTKMIQTDKGSFLTITIPVAFELNHGQQAEIYAAVQTAAANTDGQISTASVKIDGMKTANNDGQISSVSVRIGGDPVSESVKKEINEIGSFQRLRQKLLQLSRWMGLTDRIST